MDGPARAASRLARYTPVVLRLVFGLMMAAHGWQKLDGGVAGFGTFLDRLGVPLPGLAAWVVTILELGGGILLVLGLLTRIVALLLAVELVFAIILATWDAGLIGQGGPGYERDLAYIAGFLALVLLGPGRPSVDHAVGLESGVPVVGAAA